MIILIRYKKLLNFQISYQLIILALFLLSFIIITALRSNFTDLYTTGSFVKSEYLVYLILLVSFITYLICKININYSKNKNNDAFGNEISHTISITSFLISAYGILELFGISFLPHATSIFQTYHFPLVSTLGNPNFVGEFVLASFPFSLYLAFIKNTKSSYFIMQLNWL